MYKAAKILKVQTENGIEIRKPGDMVPEAENWPNVGTWLNRGYIVPANPEASLGPKWDRTKLKPAKEATEEDIRRGKNSKVPEPKKPLPEVEAMDKLLKKDEFGYDEKKAELLSLSRADLDALAIEKGLDPREYTNKNTLTDAILNG